MFDLGDCCIFGFVEKLGDYFECQIFVERKLGYDVGMFFCYDVFVQGIMIDELFEVLYVDFGVLFDEWFGCLIVVEDDQFVIWFEYLQLFCNSFMWVCQCLDKVMVNDCVIGIVGFYCVFCIFENEMYFRGFVVFFLGDCEYFFGKVDCCYVMF